jgi:hypothetical protein
VVLADPDGRRRPRVIREAPGVAEAAAVVCSAHDYRDLGKPKIAWDDEQARMALVSALINDAVGLPGQLLPQIEGPTADAAGLLVLVAGHDAGSAGLGRNRRAVADRPVHRGGPGGLGDRSHRRAHPQEPDAVQGPEAGLFTVVEMTEAAGTAATRPPLRSVGWPASKTP